MQIGANCTIFDSATGNVVIGSDVVIEQNVTIVSETRSEDAKSNHTRLYVVKNVTIGDGVRIRHGSVILYVKLRMVLLFELTSESRPGVAIGECSIIEVGSCVHGIVPPFSVVRGSPARIIGYIPRPGTVQDPNTWELPSYAAATADSATPEEPPDEPTPKDEPLHQDIAVVETDGVIDQEPIEHMDVDEG